MYGSLKIFALVLLTCAMSRGFAAETNSSKADTAPAERTLFDFSQPEDIKPWYTVNDNVMGGVSKGQVRAADDALVFYGSLSLENNGGFASVRTKRMKLDLAEGDRLIVRYKGDGRRYYLSLYVPTLRVAYSFRTPIATEKDKWQETSLPIERFKATSFGREIRNAAPVDPSRINAIGFLIADKREGPFKLEVAWIKVAGGEKNN